MPKTCHIYSVQLKKSVLSIGMSSTVETNQRLCASWFSVGEYKMTHRLISRASARPSLQNLLKLNQSAEDMDCLPTYV